MRRIPSHSARREPHEGPGDVTRIADRSRAVENRSDSAVGQSGAVRLALGPIDRPILVHRLSKQGSNCQSKQSNENQGVHSHRYSSIYIAGAIGSSGRESVLAANGARKTDGRQKEEMKPDETCELENIGKRTK